MGGRSPASPSPPAVPAPEDRRVTLDVRCTLAGVPKRTARWYPRIGLPDRPVGESRGAHRLSPHLDKLLRIRLFADAGLSLARIRDEGDGRAG